MVRDSDPNGTSHKIVEWGKVLNIVGHGYPDFFHKTGHAGILPRSDTRTGDIPGDIPRRPN